MFDTVLFRHVCNDPCLDSFTPLGKKFVFNPPPVKGHALPQLTWRTVPSGVSYLDARVSLPKMLFANNVQMLSGADIPRALDAVTGFVSDVVGVEFNAWTANIGRLDVCHNWHVGEAETYTYLHALRNAHLSKMTRRVIDDGTVDFAHDSQQVVFYAKHAETQERAKVGKATDEHLHASIGVLRGEHRYVNSRGCISLASILKLDSRRADNLLTEEVAETVMHKTVKDLGLDKSIESGDSRLALLRERYGFTSTYETLAGFLQLCDTHGADNLVRLGYHAEKFRRRRKQVEAAGAWLTNPTRATLPRLRLVRGNVAAPRAAVGLG
jgi:hypothetical protein